MEGWKDGRAETYFYIYCWSQQIKLQAIFRSDTRRGKWGVWSRGVAGTGTGTAAGTEAKSTMTTSRAGA